MSTVTVIYHQNVQRDLMDPAGQVGRILWSRTLDVEAEAKRQLSNRMVNVRTGYLRASTTSAFESENGELIGVVYSAAEYAAYVHQHRPYMTTALATVARSLR